MPIAVRPARIVGDVAVFDSDRSLTGQDGAGFDSAAANASTIAPALLAQRLFAADAEIAHVFVASSQVVVRRRAGWDDAARDRAAGVITAFFVHYPERP
jgi:hypothetical protein